MFSSIEVQRLDFCEVFEESDYERNGGSFTFFGAYAGFQDYSCCINQKVYTVLLL
jgi:hypothetical protein